MDIASVAGGTLLAKTGNFVADRNSELKRRTSKIPIKGITCYHLDAIIVPNAGEGFNQEEKSQRRRSYKTNLIFLNFYCFSARE